MAALKPEGPQWAWRVARLFRFLVRSRLAVSFIFVISSAGPLHLALTRAGRRALVIVYGLFDLELSMRYETLTLGGNVIRFPVELRAKPSIDLLIDVAPDSREVELIAEAFGFDAPDPEVRAKADRAMAERIAAMDLPVDRQERRAALNGILKPFVDRAVAACAHARQASLRSDADNEKFAKAQMEGGYWLAPLKEAADYWAVEAARLQIVAHETAQAAHGVGRAIEFAKLIAAETALAQ
jgi:hypothetical protein